jgi:uncharacterized membrane protein YgcG
VLNPVTKWHHVVVAVAAAIIPVLVLLGLAGDGLHAERFEAKQILVTPVADGGGVRIRETVDIDFGNTPRHGYQRTVRNDFGAPVDITASSPDAPDQLNVTSGGVETEIKIGDAATTITGQHRYTLEYTLPNANLSQGRLRLDVISSDETLETGRFEVVVAGMDLTDPRCITGTASNVIPGGCELVADGDVFRAIVSPLPAGQGLAVAGDIASLGAPTDVPAPAIPTRRRTNQVPLLLATTLIGASTGVGTFLAMRRKGRNVVGGTGPADAAFGSSFGKDRGPGRLVTDRELEALATTEFEAPRGLRPWHGALLLRERIDNDTVSAWFSDQIAQGIVELDPDGKRLTAGPGLDRSAPITRRRIDTLLGDDAELTLGSYQPKLSTLWKEIEAEQKVAARESGWWERNPPGSPSAATAGFGALAVVLLAILAFVFFTDLRHAEVACIIGSFIAALAVATVAYRPLLPRRSASGSAAALQAESFRRFLKASEGKHVDWAWEHRLLREYSAWAVALGAADAWGRAVAASAVPPPEVSANTTPLLMYAYGSSWQSTHSAPSTSGGGGGGGGFSGGGGFGGGGSSGSW